LVSADARVDDLAYRLIIVLRRERWQMSHMTDCPRLDTVPRFMIVGRSVRSTSEDAYYRRCGAEQQSAVARRPLVRLGWHCERIGKEKDVFHSRPPV
jgi:hypothetical protein